MQTLFAEIVSFDLGHNGRFCHKDSWNGNHLFAKMNKPKKSLVSKWNAPKYIFGVFQILKCKKDNLL